MNELASPSNPTPWFLFDHSNDAGDMQPDDLARTINGSSALLLENPVGIIRADTIGQVPEAIKQLQQAIDDGLHAAGFFSYELGYALEPSLAAKMPDNRQVPLIWFALFPAMETMNEEALACFLERKKADLETSGLEDLRPSLSKSDYLHRFRHVKELIASGDIYQVNLSFKLDFEYGGAPFSLYTALRECQPVPYGAFLQTSDFAVLSLSPELFFEARNRGITTRPMKGTMRRGTTMEEDEKLADNLRLDPKNRAENLMIADLMRNDFARICEVGSVKVSDLYKVSPFPTLFQMTSGVEGKLRQGTTLEDIIRALVPAGSITGAPKIRAQEVIRQLEEGPRGLYCGAMGVLSGDRQSGQLSALFNVAIRTLTLFPDGRGETGIGSGIVQDSKGPEEYEECLLKAKFLSTPGFKLIETMRLDADTGYYLLERHLARLERSARQLGFLCPVARIRKDLKRLANSLNNDCYMVRLLLSTGGRYKLTSTKIDPPDATRQITFAISSKRVDHQDNLLAHKTTRRQLFDDQWAEYNRHFGTQEVLFLNQRDELTEGSRSNLFIERDGKMLTPMRTCGLLPGTLREDLLSRGKVVEAVLKLDDLQDVKIWFGNSVRGLQPARLVVPE